jgi:hypothetical protein
MRLSAFAVALALALPVTAQETRMEFEPQVGTTGTRVTITSPLPKGAVVRFSGRVVPLLVEPGRRPSFIVPEGSTSAFVEATEGGKVISRSSVPFVVAGASLINTPRLIGLKEAIDVFGYAEPMPEGGEKPETKAKRILSLGDGEVLTIGEPPPPVPPGISVGNDAASAATRGMGSSGFLLTARAPVARPIVVPPLPLFPAPTPTPTPTPTPGPPAS